MVLVKILKRRDGASVVAAVSVALVLFNLVQAIPSRWAGWISDLKNGQYYGSVPPGAGWKAQYLYPVVYAILELLLLEVLGWLYVWSRPAAKK